MVSTILPTSKLKYLNIKGLNCFQVFWSPSYAYSWNATQAREASHPQHEQAKRRWHARSDPLWWSCLISLKVGGNKRVVRSWLTRRGRVAITDALKRKGYAKDGRRLAKGSEKSETGDLTGTSNILVGKDMLQASFQDVQQQADMVIEEWICRQRLDGGRVKVGNTRRVKHHSPSLARSDATSDPSPVK